MAAISGSSPDDQPTTKGRLHRSLVPMPDDVRAILAERGLTELYAARPAYQRNDWLAWIERAKRAETRTRRIASMCEELAAGHGYMGMPWHPRGRALPD